MVLQGPKVYGPNVRRSGQHFQVRFGRFNPTTTSWTASYHSHSTYQNTMFNEDKDYCAWQKVIQVRPKIENI